MINLQEDLIDLSAGGCHSAFLTKDQALYLTGDGTKGQLGIGDCECVFSPLSLKEHKVKKVACGESHTIIQSMAVNEQTFSIKSAGSNDKY